MARSDHEEEDRRPTRTTVPGASKAAGVLWVIAGTLAAIVSGFGAYRLGISLRENGPDYFFVGVLGGWLVLTLFGMMAGIRTIAGRSTEPIVNGVVSLLFFLLFLGLSLLMADAGVQASRNRAARQVVGDEVTGYACLFVLYGLLLLAAGILALTGRNEYVRFRAHGREQRLADEPPPRR